MVVTTVALDETTHYRLKLAALERRTVLTEVVREAVGEWLRRNGPDGKPKKARRRA
jgi:hypothetical protein